MKKRLLLAIAALIAIFVILIVILEIISFGVVKKTADKINLDLNQKFQQVVRIPAVVPPSFRGYYQTIYSWEMETPQKEVIKVVFTHDTGISRSQNKIMATLSMEPNADASLFNKVLPAVVADQQALSTAQDQQHANFGSNDKIGYSAITIDPVQGDNSKVTRITWEFEKDKITKGEENLYAKLNRFPEPLLKLFYSIQQFTIRAFAGN